MSAEIHGVYTLQLMIQDVANVHALWMMFRYSQEDNLRVALRETDRAVRQ